MSILLLNYFNNRLPENEFLKGIHGFLPLFIQFAFGGLFSGFFIFYSRSATLSASWPFILILLTLLIGNEFFKKRYQRITFQVSIYFVAIFSFSIFFIPILLNKIGPFVFIFSGVVSLLVIYLFTLILSYIVPESYGKSRKNLRKSVIFLFILINVLYFGNYIPPIPLSLKDAGAYYSVKRVGNSYEVLGEEMVWYKKIFSTEKLYLKKGETAYVFSSVFAPTDLNTDIIHEWQYFDDVKGKWISASKIRFSIQGGRGDGYRGFSIKEGVFQGKWRVDIKTNRNQIIGRVRFDVVSEGFVSRLEEKTL